MMASFEERLTELEVRLAFIDDTVNALNGVVADQDRRVQQLSDELERLRAELLGVRSALSHDIRDEPPPPHY
ncbi:SlyX family protein [Dokdonella koreensis]|uniref:Protein SlyX homolog n=1 Tax=Dokdonella koreensis DS-123 TaxID=1300342 RepID=A0A160DSH2_9GAMM|nr:SlyX family protein [Dokdonella koreensis DS-123]